MTIEDMPQDVQESVQEQYSYRAMAASHVQLLKEQECLKTTEDYQEYIKMMETVEARNKAIIEGNRELYKEYTAMLADDTGLGDC